MDKIILQAHELFKDADFNYAICGGFALEMFAGERFRDHADLDITIFHCDRGKVLQFLHNKGWGLYARYADTRYVNIRSIGDRFLHLIEDPQDDKWNDSDNAVAVLPDSYATPVFIERAGIHALKFSEPKLEKLDFIKIAFDKRQDNNLIAKEASLPMEKAVLHADGVPYMTPELVLYLKASEFYWAHPLQKPKSEADFKTIMPLLSPEQKDWLMVAIKTAFPEGAPWLDGILEDEKA